MDICTTGFIVQSLSYRGYHGVLPGLTYGMIEGDRPGSRRYSFRDWPIDRLMDMLGMDRDG